jgi:hypothetical protein
MLGGVLVKLQRHIGIIDLTSLVGRLPRKTKAVQQYRGRCGCRCPGGVVTLNAPAAVSTSRWR